MSERTYTLKKPIKFGEQEIKVLTFREIIAKDMDDYVPGTQPSFGYLRKMAARLTGHPPTAFDTMSGGDLAKVVDLTADCLGEFLEIGESSS